MQSDKTIQFIEKAKIIHSGENLDYSKVVYKNNRTPVLIIDNDVDENGNVYGEYWQTPTNHLRGASHPKKRSQKISIGKRISKEEFIKKAKLVHKDENMDYSEVDYINMHTKVKIICHDLDKNGDEYGEFWQEPSAHLKGCTHPRKAIDKNANNNRYTTEEFIQKCKLRYGEEKYSYNDVNYVNSKTKVIVFCNKIGSDGKPHGKFLTSPDLFLQGKGCPKCGYQTSKNEDEIYVYLCSLVDKNEIIRNDTKILNGLELDLFLPKYNFAIEYNGLRWHSEKFGKDRNYHLNKTNKCKENGIVLYQIFEDEFLINRGLIFDKIAHILNKNTNKLKIPARKCIIREINTDIAKQFLEKYHIQGFASSSVYIGCFFNDEIISVMTFKICKKNGKDWELTRFCCNNNYICQGCASKSLHFFITQYKPSTIKTFLDRRYCFNEDNNLYTKIGFKKNEYIAPNYRYTNGNGKRIHKFLFRKNILNKKYNLPLEMTESEMVKELGYEKIWDCGLIKYIWRRTELN